MSEETPSGGSTGTGLDPKVSSLLAYLLGIVGGIVFYAISKDSYVRFHAVQSILLSIAMGVIYGGVTILGFAVQFIFGISWLLYFAFLAVWIIVMVKAYGGERYKLPVIGDMAEKYAK